MTLQMPSPQQNHASKEQAPISVLIVEDHEKEYHSLYEILSNVGPACFQIDWVKTVQEGITTLTNHCYDVCLLAYHLGSDTAEGFLRELATYGESSTAVLVLTEEENLNVDQRVIQAGAMDCLVKSELNPVLVERAIRHALTHRLNKLALQEYATELEQKNQELTLARNEALSAVRLKSELLRNMSHETRTPLAGISGLTRMLQDTNLTGEQREVLSIIEDCADSLLFMINNVLDLSQLEQGQLLLQHIPFHIRTTLDHVITQVASQAKEKHLTCATIIHPDTPEMVQGDPSRIRQILLNLLSNAIKFSEAGEIKIEVTCQLKNSQEADITFTVTDSGVGMNPETQKRAYEAFMQGDGSSKRKYSGIGLGLAVTKHLAELMGGTTGMESSEGHGSRFWVTLPFFYDFQENHTASTSQPESTGPKPILLVEDNAVSQKVLLRALKKLGYRVDVVSTAREATQAVSDHHYQIVLLDEWACECDPEATAMLEHSLANSSTPLVIMTNAPSPISETCAVEKPKVFTLPKPIKMADLAETIASWTPPPAMGPRDSHAISATERETDHLQAI